MGGFFSVSLSCDQVVNQVSQCLCVQASFIHNIEKNLIALTTTMEELTARRDDLLGRMEREESRGLRRLALIQLEEIKKLISDESFDVVGETIPISEVVEMPIQPQIVGQETMLKAAWTCLIENGVGLLGLHGMGGVGKTTLLKQINNEFLKEENTFDIVIWVVVSKDLQIQKIQEEVAKKLCLDGGDGNRKDEDQKACQIHSILRRKKFVLLLDDIWAKVDLTKIGVPSPSRENKSKVVFTTRSQEVCRRMGVDVEMVVQCLSPEDALDLFQKKIGEVTLRSHLDIPELSKIVAQKCRGLPLALNVIGEAMSCKRTIQEWHHAIRVLTSNAISFSGMEDEILPILKYSYDDLRGEQVKSCLQYCALFPEDERISKGDLIEYWICEGIIDDSEGMGNAENQGYEIIGSLVRSSLLMDGEKKDKVHMHDVVREMALWIASDFGKQKDNFIVHAGTGLYEMPKFKKWDSVKKMSLMANEIDHISGSLECVQLTTLFLQKNKIKTLDNNFTEFFKSMARLVVLDLSSNRALSELPDELSQLVSLKYLNMSKTIIDCLPVGLRELKNLIHLNLERTRQLTSIVGISALLNLKVLKLLYSGVVYSPKTKEEFKFLEHLEILTISINSDSGLDEFLCSHKLMCCTQDLSIKGCQLESSYTRHLACMKKVRELYLDCCTISEIKIDAASITKIVSPLQNPKNTFFLSLSKITLYFCKFPKELTWLILVPNLTWLFVHKGAEVEEIINKEKACEGEDSGIVPFRKLEFLKFAELPKLENIYWKPLPFPCLKVFYVINCPNLRKLPLNSISGEEGLVIYPPSRKWLEGFEWEDEDTKARFLPSCRLN